MNNIARFDEAMDGNSEQYDITEGNESREEADDMHEEKVEELKTRLKNTLAKLEGRIAGRIDNDVKGYEKALKIFEKHVDNLPKTTDSALQNSLCKFAETSAPALSVTQRKNGRYINVQATSKSRRTFKLRGSRSAYFGAPTKVQKKKVQMVVTDLDEVLGHKLPGMSKKKKKKNPHNLMRSVNAGRSAEKKH